MLFLSYGASLELLFDSKNKNIDKTKKIEEKIHI